MTSTTQKRKNHCKPCFLLYSRSYCACGNTFKLSSIALSSCVSSCSGDPAEICGDSGTLFSVYTVSSKINFRISFQIACSLAYLKLNILNK